MSEFDDSSVARLRAALAELARTISREVGTGGMTRSQLSVLGSINRLGPLSVSELAAIEGLNPTMLSRILNSLEEADLAARTPETYDRRVVKVAGTAKGELVHRKLRAEQLQLLSERLQLLDADSVEVISNALPVLEELAAELSRRAHC